MNDTIANPELFSCNALFKRLIQKGLAPNARTWFFAQCSEPREEDLLNARELLEPRVQKYNSIYKKLRHKYRAHRGMESYESIKAFFKDPNKYKITAMLQCVYTLVFGL